MTAAASNVSSRSIPLHVTAEAGRDIAGHDLKHASDGIARAQNLIYLFLHALLRFLVCARQ